MARTKPATVGATPKKKTGTHTVKNLAVVSPTEKNGTQKMTCPKYNGNCNIMKNRQYCVPKGQPGTLVRPYSLRAVTGNRCLRSFRTCPNRNCYPSKWFKKESQASVDEVREYESKLANRSTLGKYKQHLREKGIIAPEPARSYIKKDSVKPGRNEDSPVGTSQHRQHLYSNTTNDTQPSWWKTKTSKAPKKAVLPKTKKAPKKAVLPKTKKATKTPVAKKPTATMIHDESNRIFSRIQGQFTELQKIESEHDAIYKTHKDDDELYKLRNIFVTKLYELRYNIQSFRKPLRKHTEESNKKGLERFDKEVTELEKIHKSFIQRSKKVKKLPEKKDSESDEPEKESEVLNRRERQQLIDKKWNEVQSKYDSLDQNGDDSEMLESILKKKQELSNIHDQIITNEDNISERSFTNLIASFETTLHSFNEMYDKFEQQNETGDDTGYREDDNEGLGFNDNQVKTGDEVPETNKGIESMNEKPEAIVPAEEDSDGNPSPGSKKGNTENKSPEDTKGKSSKTKKEDDKAAAPEKNKLQEESSKKLKEAKEHYKLFKQNVNEFNNLFAKLDNKTDYEKKEKDYNKFLTRGEAIETSNHLSATISSVDKLISNKINKEVQDDIEKMKELLRKPTKDEDEEDDFATQIADIQSQKKKFEKKLKFVEEMYAKLPDNESKKNLKNDLNKIKEKKKNPKGIKIDYTKDLNEIVGKTESLNKLYSEINASFQEIENEKQKSEEIVTKVDGLIKKIVSQKSQAEHLLNDLPEDLFKQYEKMLTQIYKPVSKPSLLKKDADDLTKLESIEGELDKLIEELKKKIKTPEITPEKKGTATTGKTGIVPATPPREFQKSTEEAKKENASAIVKEAKKENASAAIVKEAKKILAKAENKAGEIKLLEENFTDKEVVKFIKNKHKSLKDEIDTFQKVLTSGDVDELEKKTGELKNATDQLGKETYAYLKKREEKSKSEKSAETGKESSTKALAKRPESAGPERNDNTSESESSSSGSDSEIVWSSKEPLNGKDKNVKRFLAYSKSTTAGAFVNVGKRHNLSKAKILEDAKYYARYKKITDESLAKIKKVLEKVPQTVKKENTPPSSMTLRRKTKRGK